MQRMARAAAALGISVPTSLRRSMRYLLAWSAVAVTAFLPVGQGMAAGTLTISSVSLSDSRPSAASVNYTFTGSSVDGAAAIKCVKVIWSTTSSGDTAPAGFSGASGSVTAASSTLINSSATNWSLAKSDGTSSSGQNNIYQYTNSAAGVTPSTTSGATFVLGGITNPSTADTAYFFHLNTYTNTDCVTGPVDNATAQFINTNGSQLSLTIDPTLSFTVSSVGAGQSCDATTSTQASTSTTINFDSVNSGTNAVVCQDLSAATNATNGYSIYTRYTSAPTDGPNSITDHSGTNASPTAFTAAGTEGYGYSTDDATLGTGTADRFTNPSQGWAAMTTSNAEIAYEPSSVTSTTYRIGHQAGVSLTTAAGTYQTTIIYTCTPVY